MPTTFTQKLTPTANYFIQTLSDGTRIVIKLKVGDIAKVYKHPEEFEGEEESDEGIYMSVLEQVYELGRIGDHPEDAPPGEAL